MKKTIILIALMGMVFSSCSSDSGEKNIRLSLSNIAGNWYIKSIVKPDGSIVPYIDNCSQYKDYIQFYSSFKMEFYQYTPDCSNLYISDSCTNYYFLEGNIISNCRNLIDGKVVVLKAKEMEIDYQETRNFLYVDNNFTSAKGIILYRD